MFVAKIKDEYTLGLDVLQSCEEVVDLKYHALHLGKEYVSS
jgi:hypothetical protein